MNWIAMCRVPPGGARPRIAFLMMAGLAVVMGTVGGPITNASAAFGISAFDGAVSADTTGNPYTQAGGHPYAASTTFDLKTKIDSVGNVVPDGGGAKDVIVDLPPGFIGNPTITPTCRPSDFVSGESTISGTCASSSQVGVTYVKFSLENTPPLAFGPIPIYNLDPPPGTAALFGFKVLNAVVFLDGTVRSDDFGLRVRVRNVSEALTLLGSSVTFWGVPADPSHDGERFCKGTNSVGCGTDESPRAFLSNPTSCTSPGQGVETRLMVSSWDSPDVVSSAHFFSHNPPGYSLEDFKASVAPRADLFGSAQGPTGCESLPFNPSIAVRPDTTEPDAPTGLSVRLDFPQDGLSNPAGLATAALKQATVTLPEGFTVAPGAADGLQACSDAELRLGASDPPRCPDAAKIGTATAETPLLGEPLEGAVYVGTQRSDDPQSGDMFRLFMILENKDRGLLVKLRGSVRVDSRTGQIEATFANNPQLPVARIALHLKGGSRAALATPQSCGQQVVHASLVSWGGQQADLTDSFAINCSEDLGGFDPAFHAGTLVPSAGAFSPFTARIERGDRQQTLSGVSVEAPQGMLARLRGVQVCEQVAAAGGTCPLESRVGTAAVGAGPGATPFFLQGSVSLTGPYKDAPYGLSVAVRALAGPFDLGTVVVRQAIYVDPTDAHLTVVSDPLPTVVKGVQLRLRTINVDIDRPGFTLNPTGCSEREVAATLSSTQATVRHVRSRFQIGNCAQLPVAPRLALKLTGRKQTSIGRHPGFRAVLRQGRNQANLRRVAVTLPLSLALDPLNAGSDALCGFEEGKRAECPKSAIIGRARAVSPLLNRPLIGNVYFVKNVRVDKKTGRSIRTLPTLLLALRGEVALNVRARTSVSRGRLVTTFGTVPDAPVTDFELTLKGGAKGILVVTGKKGVCRGAQAAQFAAEGHNGRVREQRVPLTAPCRAR